MFAVPAFFGAAVHHCFRSPAAIGRSRAPAGLAARRPRGSRRSRCSPGACCCSRAPSHAGDVWAWPLAPLAAEAIAAWLLGIGGSAAYIALRGDREDMPGPALSYVVLGAVWIGGAIFGGDAFHNRLDACSTCCSRVSVIAVGLAGAALSHREGALRARRTSRLVPGTCAPPSRATTTTR